MSSSFGVISVMLYMAAVSLENQVGVFSKCFRCVSVQLILYSVQKFQWSNERNKLVEQKIIFNDGLMNTFNVQVL